MFSNTYVGTPFYMSPEIINRKCHTSKTDIWSLGCIIYRLCTKEEAFHSENLHCLFKRITKGQYEQIPNGYSKGLGKLIAKCLTVEPDRRPDAAQLVEEGTIQALHYGSQVRAKLQGKHQKELENAKYCMESKLEEVWAEAKKKVEEETIRMRQLEAQFREDLKNAEHRIEAYWALWAKLEVEKNINKSEFRMRKELEAQYREECTRNIKIGLQARITSIDEVPRSDALGASEQGTEPSFNPVKETEIQKMIENLDLTSRPIEKQLQRTRSDWLKEPEQLHETQPSISTQHRIRTRGNRAILDTEREEVPVPRNELAYEITATGGRLTLIDVYSERYGLPNLD